MYIIAEKRQKVNVLFTLISKKENHLLTKQKKEDIIKITTKC